MSVAFDSDTMVIECNVCHRKATYRGTWRECWSAAKADGWRRHGDDSGPWVDRCPDCNKEAEETAE